jgi:LPS O-antigen subunit length determinant protein (WzzB/FepE family)
MASGAATIAAAGLALMLLLVRSWHRQAILQRAELEQVV